MQNDSIIKEIDQAIFANICMGLRYAYKYEENKRKTKIEKKEKKLVKERFVPVIPGLFRFGSIPVFKRTGKSVVRLTDSLDMTLDVYHGRKTTLQQ